MKKLRKFLVVSVMVLSVLAMSFPFGASVKAAASTGDLIKMAGNPAVYYMGANSKIYVFTNSVIYFTWYKDFKSVVTIPAAELQSYTMSGNVAVRPGTKLVKNSLNPTVYAVEPNATLRAITSEAQAISLYGTAWGKRVTILPDSVFVNYTVGAPLATGSIPAGSLVKNAGSSTLYYYDGTNYRMITDAAVAANRFVAANALTLATTITASGSPVASTEFVDVSQKGGTNPGPVITGSGLMVSLNSNTQVASTVVSSSDANKGGQSIAPLASFNLTAANDGAITVKSLRLHRIGVSSDNTLSNVYLYSGNTKLTDAGTLSSGYVTFSNSNGIVTVPAGQTVTVTVKADIAAVMNGTIGMSIDSASDVSSTGASVSGSFPLNGNLMSVTQVSDLATVTATAPTPSNSGNTVDAGTMSNTLWSSQLAVSQKAVKLGYVSFRQIGSISADAIQNLKLYVNGAPVGSPASIDTNGRVNFDLTSNPVLLNTGNSTVELRGDIVKGSNYNFIFSIQTAADMVLTDTNYGVNIAIAGASGVSLPLSPVSTTINAGSVSVQRDINFTATQFVANQSQTVLGQWTMKAYGEDIRVQSLNLKVDLTSNGSTIANGDGFNNVSIYVNGATVGSSKNAVVVGGVLPGTLTFGSTNLFTIPAGTTVTVAIKGDSVNSGNIASAKASLVALSNAYEGITSFVYSNELASDGVSLTTGSANATVSVNGSYPAQTLSSNTNGQKIGSYMIQASSADGVTVSSLSVGLTTDGTTTLSTPDINKLSNLYVVTPDMPNGSNKANPGVNNNFNVNFTVAANQTAQVDVYADLAGTTSVATFKTTLLGSGTGLGSRQSVVLTKAQGQSIAIGNGSLNSLALSGSSPVSQIVVGGTNGSAVATYNFVAGTTGGVTISKLGFAFASSSAISTAVSSITVGGQTAAVVGGKALVSGLNLVVPASYGGLDVPVTANFAPVGLNGVPDQPVTITLAHVEYLAAGVTTYNDASSLANGAAVFGTGALGIFSGATTGVAAKTMQLAGVAPMVSLVPTTGNLTTGIVKIGSVTILAPTGNVNLKTLPIVVSASGATTTIATSSDVVIKDASTGSTITTVSGAPSSGVTSVDFTAGGSVPLGYQIASGSTGKTLDVYVNVSSISGASGTGRVNLGLSSNKALFSWTDVNGNSALDATYILNYPNTTVSIVN